MLRRTTTEALVMALALDPPHKWEYHRWLGSDHCNVDLGLLEACCGILSAVYPVFVKTFHDRNLLQAINDDANYVLPADRLGDVEIEIAGDDEDGNADSHDVAPMEPSTHSSDSIVSDALRKEKTHHRKTAMRFIKDGCFSILIITRMVLAICMDVITSL